MAQVTLRPVAKLIPPAGDKSWSFQIINRLAEHEPKVMAGMSKPVVKAANPFLQGCSQDWLMVEFWTKDKTLVTDACRQLAKEVGLAFSEGQFTREDLGFA